MQNGFGNGPGQWAVSNRLPDVIVPTGQFDGGPSTVRHASCPVGHPWPTAPACPTSALAAPALFAFLGLLGPGLIAANAGNDAGGIATYSSVGAKYGYSAAVDRWC